MSASTSAVTVTLFVTLLAVPVVNDANEGPAAGAVFQGVVPLHVFEIVETSSVRLEPGAVVMCRFSVAESAPPVVGIAQLERSKRTSSHWRLPDFGLTPSVVAPPKLDVALCSST